MAKAKPVSFRFLGIDKHLPRWLGGTGGYTTEQLHAGDALPPDGALFEKHDNGADDTSITRPHGRHWWGTRKVAKRSKKEVMQEVIAKSKLHKYERQKAKEDDDDLRMELDEGFGDILSVLRGAKKASFAIPSEQTSAMTTGLAMNPERQKLLDGQDRSHR